MSRVSKFMSRVLRHEPDAIGLDLGPGGWVAVADLLKGMKGAGYRIGDGDLLEVVARDEKRRFTVSSDGKRIRAAQGHSIPIDLQLEPSAPPDTLYHGTASANLDSIFAKGINAGRRNHVHLSLDTTTAARVGGRHGKAVVLRVDTAAMMAQGHVFWVADNGVWLTLSVPPSFLRFA